MVANSIKDQLLKAGLVDSNKVKQANREKHKQLTQKQKASDAAADSAKRQSQQASAQKAERDRELNRQKAELENKKAIAAQIKQLVETHRVPKGDGDGAYHFQDANKIRRIYVSAATRSQIVSGELVIVRVAGTYELVPKPIAEKIALRDPSRVLIAQAAASEVDEEGDYAKFKIPDDLMW